MGDAPKIASRLRVFALVRNARSATRCPCVVGYHPRAAEKKPPTAWGRTSAGPALGGAGVYRRPACAGGTQAMDAAGFVGSCRARADASAGSIPTPSHTPRRGVTREFGFWSALSGHTERTRTVHFLSSKHFERFALAP
jgi:hypothetical protein